MKRFKSNMNETVEKVLSIMGVMEVVEGESFSIAHFNLMLNHCVHEATKKAKILTYSQTKEVSHILRNDNCQFRLLIFKESC